MVRETVLLVSIWAGCIKVHDMNQPPDIFFRVVGAKVPADHGYALFGALFRILEVEDDHWRTKDR